MQVIRLVKGGEVDKVIAFDSLPADLISGLRQNPADGFPRHWKSWLKEVGCIKKSSKWNHLTATSYSVEEPAFYIIEYIYVNKDKERWQEITNHVRKNCDPSIRLLDKFEDMAKPLALDAYQPLSLEPEDVPVILLQKELVLSESDPVKEVASAVEQPAPAPLVKRGRPKKIVEAAA